MSNLTRNGASPASTLEEAPARTVTVTPRVDVVETEQEVLVLADMPGVKPGDVDVRFEKGELTIHGVRAAAHAEKESQQREYEATNYFRAFGVAESIAADQISAELRSGVLTVHLPKVEAVKPRKITVKG
jgi:HSP20 family protein